MSESCGGTSRSTFVERVTRHDDNLEAAWWDVL